MVENRGHPFLSPVHKDHQAFSCFFVAQRSRFDAGQGNGMVKESEEKRKKTSERLSRDLTTVNIR